MNFSQPAKWYEELPAAPRTKPIKDVAPRGLAAWDHEARRAQTSSRFQRH